MDANVEFQIDFFERVYKKDTENSDVIELLGNLYTQNGRIKEGLRMDLKHVKVEPKNPFAHYNLACSHALSKHKDRAFESLEKAIDLGYRDAEWMEQDPDLKSLKQDKHFRELIKRLKQKTDQ
jgi:Flp pilus assembly protein TadD